MPEGQNAAAVTVLSSILDVEPEHWDACAGTGNPFVSHAFLAALETSGSAAAETGWLPRHLVIPSADGGLAGCAPMYLKSHSYGEYVFDWGWAEAYERAGGRYYPKLQLAVPFTPVPGPRLLARPDAPADTAAVLAAATLRLAEKTGASSVHVTFNTPDEQRILTSAGYLPRIGRQYHWTNRGYGSFDNFLADLSARKRKAIRRERAAVTAEGITVRVLTGAEIDESHWDSFYRFYLDTVDRKWAHAYLNRRFFSELGTRLGDRVVLMWAQSAVGEPVGVALNLVGGDALYGRYWGGSTEVKYLHFEVCYYRAIEYAIAHGLSRVEAGAQGEHKIQRGYLPIATYSAHWIADRRLRDAVAAFLTRERASVDRELAQLATWTPFRDDARP
jgi:hypothetical protein